VGDVDGTDNEQHGQRTSRTAWTARTVWVNRRR